MGFQVKDFLQAKIKDEELTMEQVKSLITSITDGDIKEAQIGAFLMLVFLKGLNTAETVTLTKGMRDSGLCFSWPDSWKVVDKHSTGGVGDKVSLVLAPALAANGLKVPMISGRSLGHTGGTLDKLESIPGFRVNLSEIEIENILHTVGCCIVGQTDSLVPADKVLYATRDMTSTIDCIPLIVSSILSKKASEGLDGLVLDVKYGSGSFMATETEGIALARALVDAAHLLQLPCTALLTDMESPLGRSVGNSLEIIESLECLKGYGFPDLEELVINLGGELLVTTGVVDNLKTGRNSIKNSIRGKSALQKFALMLESQGVSKKDVKQLCSDGHNYTCLKGAGNITELYPKSEGYVSAIDAKKIALLCQEMGASRAVASDKIHHGVGVVLKKVIGDKVDTDCPWIEIHHHHPLSGEMVKLAKDSLQLSSTEISPKSRITKRIF